MFKEYRVNSTLKTDEVIDRYSHVSTIIKVIIRFIPYIHAYIYIYILDEPTFIGGDFYRLHFYDAYLLMLLQIVEEAQTPNFSENN